MRPIHVALTFVSLAISTTAYGGGPHGRLHVGNWSGGAFTYDNGQFGSCIASTTYRSGIMVSVMVTAEMRWGLGFMHNSWRMANGQTFPIVLTFDGKNTFNVVGRAIAQQQVLVPMPDESELIREFRKARTMSAFAQGQLFQFDLRSTSVLLPTLVNCVQITRAQGVSSSRDYTLPPKTPVLGANAPSAPATGSSLNPASAPPVSPEYQIEAIELTSNFLMKAKLNNASVVPRDQTPLQLASYGAAWKSEEATGFVRIIPTEAGTKGLDVAATVIGNDAKECKGTFVSGRKSELIDSDVVFTGLARCDDSDGSRVAQYFIVPRQKGGFVMFSVQSNMKTEQARGVADQAAASGFGKAALIAASMQTTAK